MIKYILNNQLSHPVQQVTDDNSGIQYSFNFGGSRTRLLELTVPDLTFVGEDYDRIREWLDIVGYYVGMPLDIEYAPGDVEKYLLDFSAESFEEEVGYSITVPLKKFNGTDNFFDNAMGVSFGKLPWQPNDFREIDYVVIPEAQFSYFLSLALATFALSQELANAAQEIQEGIADVVKAATPVGIPPAPDWGAIAVAAIKLAARIAYAVFIIIALIKLAIEILNLIFPIIRQLKCVGVKKLIERTAEKYGLVLQSTLLDSLEPLTIIPVPLRKKDPKFFEELLLPNSLALTYGYPSPKDVVKSPGQVLKVIEDVFNAESVIRGDKLIIENEEFFIQNAATNVDLAYNIQESNTSTVGNNSKDIFKRIVIDSPTDPRDVNTYDDTVDSTNELSSEIVNSPGASYELIKQLDFRTTTFARATRKGKLTFVEKAAKLFAEGIDQFTGGNAADIIENRKNVMQVSSQYFGVTKWGWLKGTKLDPDQNEKIGTSALAEYHVLRRIENNQKNTTKQMPWAATKEQLFEVLENNYINLDNGKVAKITTGTWSPEMNLALLDYEVRRPAPNETTIEINPG